MILLIFLLLFPSVAFAGWGFDCKHIDRRVSTFSSDFYGDYCIDGIGRPNMIMGYGYNGSDCSRCGWRDANSREIDKFKSAFENEYRKKSRLYCDCVNEKEKERYYKFLNAWELKKKESKWPLFFVDYKEAYIEEVLQPALEECEKEVNPCCM